MFIEKLWKPLAAAAFIIVAALLWGPIGLWSVIPAAIAAGATYVLTLFAFAMWANAKLAEGADPVSIFDVK